MRLVLTSTILAFLCGCALFQEKHMYTSSDFDYLKFLEGRWIGKGPDGSSFYEEYTFIEQGKMRSDRHADASYSNSTDASTVTLENGQVTSTWNTYTWIAAELSPGKACFSPVNAPSSFCWERKSDKQVHVTQRWTDESGIHQEYVISMHRSEV